MIRHVGIHRADHTDVVDAVGDVWKYLANVDPASAMLRKLERRAKCRASLALSALRGRQGTTVILVENRLRIERIDVRHSAVQKEMNDSLRLRREVRRLRSQRMRHRRLGTNRLAAQQVRETEHSEPNPRSAQHFATSPHATFSINPQTETHWRAATSASIPATASDAAILQPPSLSLLRRHSTSKTSCRVRSHPVQQLG